jgi:spore germination protein KC
MIKKYCMLLVLIILCSSFTGCYDKQEVDDMAYVIAIGIDKGKTNILRLTLQIARPTAIGGESAEGGEEAIHIITVETPSIFSGLNMANNAVSRKLNLSHAKAIVFSKELAMEDVSSYINALKRDRETRPNIQVLVSRTSAEDYIRAVNPTLVINPAKFYELSFKTYKYTAFTADTDLHRFNSNAKSISQSAVAVLAGVNEVTDSDDINLKGSTYKNKGRDLPLEGDFKAGDISKAGETQAEIMGLAVFDGSRMVGELDGGETSLYLMITGEYNESFITLPDPMKRDKVVIIDVKKSREPVLRVQLDGDKPKIYINVKLEGDIQSIQSGIAYESLENIAILEQEYENSIKRGMERLLNRSAVELKSDIFGFGKKAKANFLTWDEWEKYEWKKKYPNSTFEVEVDFKIRRTGLMVKTSPVRSSE